MNKLVEFFRGVFLKRKVPFITRKLTGRYRWNNGRLEAELSSKNLSAPGACAPESIEWIPDPRLQSAIERSYEGNALLSSMRAEKR